MKILFVATVGRHFYHFHLPVFRMLRDAGWQVDAAARMDKPLPPGCADGLFDLPFERSPYHPANIKAYGQLRKVMRLGKYDLIHCHTPVGGLAGRLAARGTGAKLLYTAHGFHFYQGAPPLHWLLYYPLERWLSRRTDCLITINEEDYAFARRKLKAKQVARVHGVGCETSKFIPARAKQTETPALIYIAELNANKNQELLLRAMSTILARFPGARLRLVGPDHFNGAYQRLSRDLRIAHAVEFTGERQDIPALLAESDLAVASSLREGLPVNVMEAMAASLPVVASDNRGHRELVRSGLTGDIVPPGDVAGFAEAVIQLLEDPARRAEMGAAGRERCREYALERVLAELREVYGL